MLRVVVHVFFLVSLTIQLPHVKKAMKKAIRQKNQFDFAKDIDEMSALFRIELLPYEIKDLHYEIGEGMTDCKIDMSFYISRTTASHHETAKASMKFIGPSGALLDELESNTKTRVAQKASLILNKQGEYTFEITNPNDFMYVVIDLVLGLRSCHKLTPKLHKDDMIKLNERFQSLYKEHTFLLNDNLASRYNANNKFKKHIELAHEKMYYSAVLESIVVIVLSLVQAFYMKRLLENKQLI